MVRRSLLLLLAFAALVPAQKRPFDVNALLELKRVGDPQLSPDGRWVAFDQDQSGRPEVYAVSFPEGTRKVQLSTNGGLVPKWTRGGKEIVYEDFDGRVMAVDVDTSQGLRAGTPRPLFQLPEGVNGGWEVTADGERFLVGVPVVKSVSRILDLVVNWPAAFRK